jgi:hypothetical protein
MGTRQSKELLRPSLVGCLPRIIRIKRIQKGSEGNLWLNL